MLATIRTERSRGVYYSKQTDLVLFTQFNIGYDGSYVKHFIVIIHAVWIDMAYHGLSDGVKPHREKPVPKVDDVEYTGEGKNIILYRRRRIDLTFPYISQ